MKPTTCLLALWLAPVAAFAWPTLYFPEEPTELPPYSVFIWNGSLWPGSSWTGGTRSNMLICKGNSLVVDSELAPRNPYLLVPHELMGEIQNVPEPFWAPATMWVGFGVSDSNNTPGVYPEDFNGTLEITADGALCTHTISNDGYWQLSEWTWSELIVGGGYNPSTGTVINRGRITDLYEVTVKNGSLQIYDGGQLSTFDLVVGVYAGAATLHMDAPTGTLDASSINLAYQSTGTIELLAGQFNTYMLDVGCRGNNLAGGIGTFSQSGGISQLGGVDLYSNQSTGAQLNLNGGVCHAQNITVAGFNDNSRLYQTAGMLDVMGSVTVGGTGDEQYDTGGLFEQSGGIFTASNLAVGGSLSAECKLNQQASATVAGAVTIGRAAGTTAQLGLYDAAALDCGSLRVQFGNSIHQIGTATTVTASNLTVDSGSYHLWNGTLDVPWTTCIGLNEAAAAHFDHAGGTLTGGDLQISAPAGGTAEYTLQGDAEATFDTVWLSGHGPSTLTLEDTDVLVTAGQLLLTTDPDEQGRLEITAGSLDLTSLTTGLGDAVAQQSGGYLTVDELAGRRANGTAAYTLTGGQLNARFAAGVNLNGGFVSAGLLQFASGDLSNGSTAVSANAVETTAQLDVLSLQLGITTQPADTTSSVFNQTLRVRNSLTIGSQREVSSIYAAPVQVGANLVLAHDSSIIMLSAAAPLTVAGATRIGLDDSAAALTLNGTLTTVTLELGTAAALNDGSSNGAAELRFHDLVAPDNDLSLYWNSPIHLGLAGQDHPGSLRLDSGAVEASSLTVGALGSAAVIHNNGTIRLDGLLELGLAGCQGDYDFANGLLFANTATIGAQGNGQFHQTGGWAQFRTSLTLGEAGGATGGYDLQAGNLDAPVIQVGAAGSGTFIQAGGRVRVTNSVNLAAAAGSTGSYQISNSSVLETGTLSIGTLGAASFDLDLTEYGVVSVSSDVNIGTGSGGSGLLTLRAGKLDASQATIHLGSSGRIQFVGGLIGDPSSRVLVANIIDFSSGGSLESSGFNNMLYVNQLQNMPDSFHFAGALNIGTWAGPGDVELANSRQLSASVIAVGSYGEGTLSLYDSASLSCNVLQVGDSGAGHLYQHSGTTTVLDEINLGYGWGTGSYTLSGGLLLASDAHLKIGGASAAGFTLMGGTANPGWVEVGCTNATGTFAINGGLLTTRSFDVGAQGTVLSSGTTGELRSNALTFAGPSLAFTGTVAIGHAGAPGTRTMQLTAGKDFSAGTLVVGHDTTATYTQSGGATHATSYLKLGNETAAQGTFTLTSGVLDGMYVIIGKQGQGELNNSGGNHTVTSAITLGDAAGSTGTYRLSANGSLQGANEYIGLSGNGSFVQSGGNHAANSLQLAATATGIGEYQLNGGDLTMSSSLYDGYRGVGRWIHNAGTCQAQTLYLGYLAGSNGTYTMSGGNLTAASQYIGYNGVGRFVQSGGSNSSASTYLYIGRSATGNGTYELSGNGVLGVYSEDIGYGSTGAFIQSGGTHTVQGALTLGSASGKSGSFNLSDGSLTAFGIYVGNSGNGLFQQSGGSIAVNTVTIGSNASGVGTFEISGGQLAVSNLNVGRLGTGTLRIQNAAANITVASKWSLSATSTFSAVPGSTVHMTGSAFENKSTDPNKLAGLSSTTLIFEGGPLVVDPVEVAGKDYGATETGFTSNFALDRLVLGGTAVGRIQLVSAIDNQPAWTGTEVLYVDSLVVNLGSNLNLNGFKVYYRQFIGNPASVTFNGGSLVQVGSDYDRWAATYATAGLVQVDTAADPDSDRLSNQTEYAFGLNPTRGSSRNPIASGLTTHGGFSYTRRPPSLTGLNYTIWVSTDLDQWTCDTAATQTAAAPVANVETVAVTLSAIPPGGRCFVRVQAW